MADEWKPKQVTKQLKGKVLDVAAGQYHCVAVVSSNPGMMRENKLKYIYKITQ
jgi:hypothetical protein